MMGRYSRVSPASTNVISLGVQNTYTMSIHRYAQIENKEVHTNTGKSDIFLTSSPGIETMHTAEIMNKLYAADPAQYRSRIVNAVLKCWTLAPGKNDIYLQWLMDLARRVFVLQRKTCGNDDFSTRKHMIQVSARKDQPRFMIVSIAANMISGAEDPSAIRVKLATVGFHTRTDISVSTPCRFLRLTVFSADVITYFVNSRA